MLRKLLLFFGITDQADTSAPVPQKEQILSSGRYGAIENESVANKKMPAQQQEKRITAKAGLKEKPVAETGREKKPALEDKIESLSEYMENYREYHLEKTGNRHLLKAPECKLLSLDGSTETLSISGDAFVIHNEHRMLRIGKGCFVKYIQQEYNPITTLTENAYD